MVETLQKVEVVLDIQFSAVNCKNLLLHRLILFALWRMINLIICVLLREQFNMKNSNTVFNRGSSRC